VEQIQIHVEIGKVSSSRGGKRNLIAQVTRMVLDARG